MALDTNAILWYPVQSKSAGDECSTVQHMPDRSIITMFRVCLPAISAVQHIREQSIPMLFSGILFEVGLPAISTVQRVPLLSLLQEAAGDFVLLSCTPLPVSFFVNNAWRRTAYFPRFKLLTRFCFLTFPIRHTIFQRSLRATPTSDLAPLQICPGVIFSF